MYCTQCGHQIADDSVFCTACGSTVPVLPPEDLAGTALAHEPAAGIDRSVGETVLFEEGEGFSHDDWDSATPIPTILDEPESITAVLGLEIDDAETGLSTVNFRLSEGQLFVIGRDVRVSDFVPRDPRSSRRHFSIVIGPEGFLVEDLGSSNGTFINGVRLTAPVVVRDGDSIEYGRSKAVFRVIEHPPILPVAQHGLLEI